MCMKKFHAEKNVFDKLTIFLRLYLVKMVDSAYFVWSTPLRAYIESL